MLFLLASVIFAAMSVDFFPHPFDCLGTDGSLSNERIHLVTGNLEAIQQFAFVLNQDRFVEKTERFLWDIQRM